MTEQHRPGTLVNAQEDTYWGRVRRFAALIDMRKMFITQTQVREAQGVAARYAAERSLPATQKTVSEEQYTAARDTCDAVLHPDTGKRIPLVLRASAIIPANLCLDAFMIRAQSFGYGVSVLAQFTNQTYNILHYWANRNASNDSTQTTRRALYGYTAAVTASVSTTLGLSWMSDRLPASLGPARALARNFVPYFAVAAADFINLCITRENEMRLGVDVLTEDGRSMGKSKIAGKSAVMQCAFARCVAAAPILLIPPVVMHKLEKRAFLQRNPRLATPILMGTIGLMIQLSVPFVFGVFRQTAAVRPTDLEPEFHGIKDPHGRPIERLYFNRGI